MRLLIVEDDINLNRQLSKALQQQGYAVDSADNGTDGLYCGTEYPIDLAIVDLGLPGFSGIELIQQLRARKRDYPILILTARADWQDKVEGLESGADDYVTKPFQMEEVIARINALLRRSKGHADPILRFGPITVNTNKKLALLNHQELGLTGFEYNALEYLAQHHGKIISKTELSEHLYEEELDRDSNVIEVIIGRLRKKMDPDSTLKPIVTIRGQGYRFNVPGGD